MYVRIYFNLISRLLQNDPFNFKILTQRKLSNTILWLHFKNYFTSKIVCKNFDLNKLDKNKNQPTKMVILKVGR